MSRIKDYYLNENNFKTIKYNECEGITNNIITVGQLNNKLNNDYAILKIININSKPLYKTPLKQKWELEKQKIQYAILIKVITTDKTYYLKIHDVISYNRLYPFHHHLFKRLSENKNLHYNFDDKYTLLKHSNYLNNRLLNVEFIITGVGFNINETNNSLYDVILLDDDLNTYINGKRSV